MLRRIGHLSSSAAAAAGSTTPLSMHSRVSRRHYSDSVGTGGNNDSSNNNNDSSAAAAAGRAMCDTADGIYAAMMIRACASTNASASASSAVRHHKHNKSNNRSVFGDSPAAVATSLMGCLFFATTYGYYIGGAVKEAAQSRFGGNSDQ